MNPAYPEPYKFQAGILALVVHGVFFTLLYFGFTWQTQRPAAMSVQLWQSLPDEVVAPPPVAQPVVPPEPEVKVQPPVVKPEAKPVPPPVVTKPDIVIKPDVKPAKKPEPKPAERKPVETKPSAHPVESKKPVAKPQPRPAEPSAAEVQAARELAEQAAATGRVVDEYMAKISSKIRRNIVMPPNVPDDASVEFSVTLLPGGRVLSARLTQSSGNAAYEMAVERAILKSEPLPLPADPAMFNRFRELKLKFKPVEKESP